MSSLIVTLKPELSTHNDGSDLTYTLDQSAILITPPGPAQDDSSPIGGGFLLSVQDLGSIDYLVVRAKCYLVNPVSGDPGSFVNSRLQWIQDNAPTNTSVGGCNCVLGSVTVTEPFGGAFNFVKIGNGITIDAGDTATLPAGTFVINNLAGVITLSDPFGGVTDASSTLYFDRMFQAEITSFNEAGFVWVNTVNLTTAPDNTAWTWDTIKKLRDVTPIGTFFQDLEPATTVMEIRCSEVEVEVWGTPLPKSYTLISHSGAWV